MSMTIVCAATGLLGPPDPEFALVSITQFGAAWSRLFEKNCPIAIAAAGDVMWTVADDPNSYYTVLSSL